MSLLAPTTIISATAITIRSRPPRSGTFIPARTIMPPAPPASWSSRGCLRRSKASLPRGILFESFAGEELGLLGSAEWVKEPTRPLDKAVAMLNMDMIGRIQGEKVYIGGVGTGSTFQSILTAAEKKFEFPDRIFKRRLFLERPHLVCCRKIFRSSSFSRGCIRTITNLRTHGTRLTPPMERGCLT